MIRKTAFESMGLAVLKICIAEGNVLIQQDMNKNSENPDDFFVSSLRIPEDESLRSGEKQVITKYRYK
jgi:hypothetical protein